MKNSHNMLNDAPVEFVLRYVEVCDAAWFLYQPVAEVAPANDPVIIGEKRRLR